MNPLSKRDFLLNRKRFCKSFGYALKGIGYTVKTQPNMRFHVVITILVLAMAWGFQIKSGEMALLLFAIALVWVAELCNTALEATVDVTVKGRHPLAGAAKDAAAGAVLVAALVAVCIGILVFLPYWRQLILG